MKIGQPEWPKLDAPIVVEKDGYWATWHGGEYIDVFTSEEGARLDAEGLNTGDANAVGLRNTTGDEVDAEDADALEQYVRDELRAWVREEG
jgi:hypothetical protein